MASVWRELKRRNVVRVAMAYVVVAWLLLQVADVVLNNTEAPVWVFQSIMLLLVIGFPLSLFFAWAFELTPEGIKKEKDVDRSESITHLTGRKLDFVIIAILAVAVVYFISERLFWGIDEAIEISVDASVAVLPFVSMSANPDDEYFSDGLTEEILNSLAQINNLKVAGRTSSFYYKGKTPAFSEVSEALGVTHVLEGSVRREGDRLRITVQLIKTDDGFHQWSKSYDRKSADIFAIQTDIATQVATALKVTLLGGEAVALSRHGTANAEALSKYLIASTHIRRGAAFRIDPTQNNEHLKTARRFLEEAVQLDPNFAEAWAKLVRAYYLLAGWGITDGSGEMLSNEEASRLAEIATGKAISLAPDLPEAWAAMAWHSTDINDAKGYYEKALNLDPDNLTTLESYADFWVGWGQYPAAVELYDRAVALDPLSTVRLRRARAMYLAGRIDDARKEYFEVAILYADAPYQNGIAEIEFDRGHFHHGFVWLTDVAVSLQAPYAWASMGDAQRALEKWGRYKVEGGDLAIFAELGDYYFLRDYQGLINAAAFALIPDRHRYFMLPPHYYLRKWEDAVAIVENWPAEDRWNTYHEDITGTAGARYRTFSPNDAAISSTQAIYYAYALASLGRGDDAESIYAWALELAERLPSTTPRRIQERHHLRLLVYASRGDTEAALVELEAMLQAGWRWLMSPGNMDFTVYSVDLGWFEDSPLLDSIRDEPRFIAAVEMVKADNAAMLAEINAGLSLKDIIDEDLE